MFSRNSRGERRASPSMYKLLVTLHVSVSVSWLGAAFSKLVLGIVAVRTSSPQTALGLFEAMQVLSFAYPPLAIGTIVTGVLLSLGTRWGLLSHYWVVTKLVLTVGVIATGIQLTERFIQRASVADDALPLLVLGIGHVAMLAMATILSIYKPW